jgi:tetratricopeptide (TPR) repeat protein
LRVSSVPPASSAVVARVYRACFVAGLLLFGGSLAAGFLQVGASQGRLPDLSRDSFRAAREALARGDRPAAIREYRKGADVDRNDYGALLAAAQGLGHAGDVEGALAVLARAERLRPGQSRTATVRGWALLANGRMAEAFGAFAAALAANDKDAVALAGAAEVLMAQRRFDDAVKLFERSVRLDPRRASTREGMGVALALGGRPQEALEQFAAAVALEPTEQRRANLERARIEAAAVQPAGAR